MPIYEYECNSCGEKFELRRSMSDSDAEINCPKCGDKNAQRVFSTFASSSTGGTSASTSCLPSSYG